MKRLTFFSILLCLCFMASMITFSVSLADDDKEKNNCMDRLFASDDEEGYLCTGVKIAGDGTQTTFSECQCYAKRSNSGNPPFWLGLYLNDVFPSTQPAPYADCRCMDLDSSNVFLCTADTYTYSTTTYPNFAQTGLVSGKGDLIIKGNRTFDDSPSAGMATFTCIWDADCDSACD